MTSLRSGFAARCWTGVVVTALVVVVGACSSSSKANTAPNTSKAGVESSAPGSPIKVGDVCTCSGAFGSDITAQQDTYKAWVQHVNATGGLEGHPIELITEDDAGNPGTSVTDATTLIADHVDAIVDLSILSTTWQNQVDSAGIPVVGGILSSGPFDTNSDFYPEGETEGSIVASIAATAKRAGLTSLGALYCAESQSCATLVGPLKKASSSLGLTVDYSGAIAATAPDYTSQCVAAQQNHVSGLLVADSFQIIARVAKDCSTQNFTPTYLAEGEGLNAVLASAPGTKTALWAQFSVAPWFDNTPGITEMDTVVDKYYPGLRQNANAWTEGAVEAWVSGLLLADAVKGGGLTPSAAPTAGEVVRGLKSLHGDTLGGMAPALTFSSNLHPVTCWFTGHVLDGTWSVANNGQTTCA